MRVNQHFTLAPPPWGWQDQTAMYSCGCRWGWSWSSLHHALTHSRGQRGTLSVRALWLFAYTAFSADLNWWHGLFVSYCAGTNLLAAFARMFPGLIVHCRSLLVSSSHGESMRTAALPSNTHPKSHSSHFALTFWRGVINASGIECAVNRDILRVS